MYVINNIFCPVHLWDFVIYYEPEVCYGRKKKINPKFCDGKTEVYKILYNYKLTKECDRKKTKNQNQQIEVNVVSVKYMVTASKAKVLRSLPDFGLNGTKSPYDSNACDILILCTNFCRCIENGEKKSIYIVSRTL